MNKIIVYTDGGARNNPGPAGIGVVIGNKEYSEYIGEKTNNEAEYQAVIFALKKLKLLLGKEKIQNTEIEINMDSELVVQQLNHQFKIEEQRLFPLFIEIWNLLIEVPNVRFQYLPREQNKRADQLVNMAIDKALQNQQSLNS